LSHATEVFLWAALCFNPQGFDAYDPIHAKNYRIKAHYHNQLWCNITWGIDCKVRGLGEDDFGWVVVKYKKDPFNALRKFPREVSHHNEYGVRVEQPIE
jgi:hypothetical protein